MFEIKKIKYGEFTKTPRTHSSMFDALIDWCNAIALSAENGVFIQMGSIIFVILERLC